MKILIASDSFKGSLTSRDIIRIATEEISAFCKEAQVKGFLLSDGGEGTIDALLELSNTKKITVKTCDALLRPIEASYVDLGNDVAVVELAQASGLTLIEKENRDPIKSSTYGVGILIRDAIKRGFKKIIVSIGGSATNDGGTGLLSALGVKFFNEHHEVLRGSGGDLKKICSVDLKDVLPEIKNGIVQFDLLTDVTNPLLGKNGAIAVYGPQKGAIFKEQLNLLENGMENFAHVSEQTLKCNVKNEEGSGAAGGTGFGLMAYLGARRRSGINAMLDMVGFVNELPGTDLVITGEGSLDQQSCNGKVPMGVCKVCKEYNIPVISISGNINDGYEKLYDLGLTSAISTVSSIMSVDNAMKNAEKLYRDGIRRVLRLLECGKKIALKS